MVDFEKVARYRKTSVPSDLVYTLHMRYRVLASGAGMILVGSPKGRSDNDLSSRNSYSYLVTLAHDLGNDCGEITTILSQTSFKS